MKIGFIGAGNMGSALARAASKYSGIEIYVSDANKEKCQALCDSLGARISENREIAALCDFVFLAVKPQQLKELLDGIKDSLSDSAILVSMAAGISISSIENMLGVKRPIIRIMPNTPVSVGRGIILTAKSAAAQDSTLSLFKEFMAASGDIYLIDEELIDAGTAVSGCSPAFVFMFIDALAEGGIRAGLSKENARIYAAKTLIGASELLLSSGKEPSELTSAVCSPGGSTIEGVKHLEGENFKTTVSDAVIASYEKTKALGK